MSTVSKRELEPESDSSSDEEGIGPTLELIQEKRPNQQQHQEKPKLKKKKKKKKRRVIKDLTINHRYVNSYMHKDEVLSLAHFHQVLISGSKDGVIKFWNTLRDIDEEDEGHSLQFIKQYQTKGSVQQLEVVPKEGIMYSISEAETSINVFDLRSFDLINIIQLQFEPIKISYAYFESELRIVVVKESHEFVIIDPEEGSVLSSVCDIHSCEIATLNFNSKYGCMISTDINGMIEYWIPGDMYKKPTNVFDSKSKTNLYDVRKAKSKAICLALSANEEMYLVLSLPDSKLRLFKFDTGLLVSEKEVDISANSNALFDESGNFIVYSNLTGIHIYNIIDGSTKIIGADEGVVFSKVLLIEPVLDKITIEMASSISNEIIKKKLNKRSLTTLVALSIKDQRFYLFNNGDTKTENDERDIYNEIPTVGKLNNSTSKRRHLVTIHTNMGDLKIKLFPEQAPLAVENFVKLCSNNYYDDIIFHRIIANFMIQTGDPTGTGTGGESIWGGTFQDEFSEDLRHFKYMVSMANAGPSTNGSQFFIVTSAEQLSHLDDKHTVFGKVVDGTDVVDEISAVEVDKEDRPTSFTPKIMSTAVTLI